MEEWEVYEQALGGWRKIDDYDSEPADDPAPGPGWEPFAAISLSNDERDGTHLVLWRRKKPQEGPK